MFQMQMRLFGFKSEERRIQDVRFYPLTITNYQSILRYAFIFINFFNTNSMGTVKQMMVKQNWIAKYICKWTELYIRSTLFKIDMKELVLVRWNVTWNMIC